MQDFTSYPTWVICENCGHGYYNYGTGCPICFGKITIHEFDFEPSTGIERYGWNNWNVLVKDGLNNFMYKQEDEWYIWTENNNVDEWDKGIIYQSKNLTDFVEAILTFTEIYHVYGIQGPPGVPGCEG